jgi:hypothetical protein
VKLGLRETKQKIKDITIGITWRRNEREFSESEKAGTHKQEPKEPFGKLQSEQGTEIIGNR